MISIILRYTFKDITTTDRSKISSLSHENTVETLGTTVLKSVAIMEIDWSKIKYWQTFEALCSTILNFKDKSIKSYMRQGKDGAIDAISKDGITVYQFKFHKSPVDPIKDAEKELKKIKKIKSDKAHTYHDTWSKVTKWVLMTNLPINKNDENKWEEQLKPSFKEIGIEPMFWSCEELEKSIRLHPLIYSEFFGEDPSSYLTLDDAIALLNKQYSVREDKDEYKSKYYGREKELEQADKFFCSEKNVLLVTGEGGVGKSRFLIEVGNKALSKNGYAYKGKQVYWANVATLAYNKRFPGIATPDIDHIILMDEPENMEFLKMLMEQLSNSKSRIKKWKFIVALRKHDEKVISLFKNYKTKKNVEHIEFKSMEIKSFNLLLDEQIGNLEPNLKSKKDLKRHLSTYTKGYPIWLHVALSIIEKGGSLNDMPKDEMGFAKRYVDQMLEDKPEETRKVLNWISLYGEIRFDSLGRGRLNFDEANEFVPDDDRDKKEFFSKQVGCDNITDHINSLENIGILKKYGGLLRVKPDVIRFCMLFDAIYSQKSNSNLSSFGESVKSMLNRVVKEDNYFVPDLDEIIATLSSIDWLIKHDKHFKNKPSILIDFIDKCVGLAKETDSVIEQSSIVDIARHFAIPYPYKIVELIHAVLKNDKLSPVKEKYMFRKFDQSFVMEKLPELLLMAARYSVDSGVRKGIVNLAIELLLREIEEENNKKTMRSYSASSAISTMIVGGSKISTYQKDFQLLALEYIEKLKKDKNPKTNLYEKLLKPLISIVRTEDYFEDMVINMNRTCLSPKSENYKLTMGIVEEMWKTLNKDTSQSGRIIIFQLLDQFVHGIHEVINTPIFKKIPKNVLSDYRQLNIDTFNKLHEKIRETWITPTDLREARKIWDWYYTYCKDAELKNIATECEDFFLSDKSNKFYTNICTYPVPNNIEEQIQNHFQPLLKGKASKLEKNILDGIDAIGNDKFYSCTYHLCDYFFIPNFDHKVIKEFIDNNICSSNEGLRDFIRNVIAIKLRDLRKNGETDEILKLLEDCENKYIKNKSELIRFFIFVYSRAKSVLGEISELEFKYFLDKEKIFNEDEKIVKFIHILTHILLSSSKKCIEKYIDKYESVSQNILEKSNPKDSANIVSAIIDRLLVSNINEVLYIKMLKLVFEMFSKIPNLRDMDSSCYSFFEIVMEKQDKWRPDIFDFKDLLFKRLEICNEKKGNFFDAISINIDLFPIFKLPPYEDKNDDEIVSCFEEIMTELNNNRSHLGFELPKWLDKFDIGRKYIPKVVIKKIEELKDDQPIENITIWSRYAGFLGEGSDGWRNVADTIYRKFDNHLIREDRISVLQSLDNIAKIESWSGKYGELSPKFQQDVNEARYKYENEDHPFIKEFYKLKLEEAKSMMDREIASHEEEHGYE